MKQNKNNKGYLIISLCKNKKQKSYLVHRLVAEAFIKKPDQYNQVNHINEVKDDNRVENLEWCTNRYNVNYSIHKIAGKPNLNYSTNTGEHHITLTRSLTYSVKIKIDKKRYTKNFKTIDEAIDWRNKMIDLANLKFLEKENKNQRK